MIQSRQIAAPLYVACAALILLPLADVSTTLYPWRLADARWRFGATGVVSNSLMLPMLGLLVAYVTATILEHRRTRQVLGILAFVAVAVCVAVLAFFALDALQTRAAVREEMRASFSTAWLSASARILFLSATLLAIGIASRRGVTRVSTSNEPLPQVAVPRSSAPRIKN